MPEELRKPKYPANRIEQPATTPTIINVPTANVATFGVQPEQMSLNAHHHIQTYLRTFNKQSLDKNDLNAVLRLSQHLRVFGLLSAVGYINQSNAQEGQVRERTVPVWESLLGQSIGESIRQSIDAAPLMRRQLMEEVVRMARNEPARYMASWRQSLLLVNHWNFWARAYQEEQD